MEHALYATQEYLDQHASPQSQNSSSQAAAILRLLSRHPLAPATIVQVGSGNAEVLNRLQQLLPEDVCFAAMDAAFAPAGEAASRIGFTLERADRDAIIATQPPADLALALENLEHTEDLSLLLYGLAARARHTIFRIPLDLSLLSLLTGLPAGTRRGTGPAHYFTRALALAALEDHGFRVLDDFFTDPVLPRQRSLTGRLAHLARLALATVDKRLAATLLGGFSLMVLAEAKESR